MRAVVAISLLTTLVLAPAGGAAQGPSDAVYRQLCRAIQPQHVRALFTRAAAPIRLGGDADCAFAPRGGNPEFDGVKIFLRINDSDKTLWNHKGDRSYGTFRWLSQSGRLAKWGHQFGSLPSVVDARSGSFTCTLVPVGSAGLAVPKGPALSAARTYAKRLLAVCDDVFAARK